MRILIFLLAGLLCLFVFNSLRSRRKKLSGAWVGVTLRKANGLDRQADHDAVFVNVCKGLVSFFNPTCLAHFSSPNTLAGLLFLGSTQDHQLVHP
jgi:hypothetical protein